MRLPSFEVTVCTGPSSPSAVRAWSSLSIPLHLAQRVIRRRPPAPTSGRRCCRVVGNARVQVQLGAAGDRAEPEDGDRGVGVLVGAGGRDYEPLRPGHVAKGDGRGAEPRPQPVAVEPAVEDALGWSVDPADDREPLEGCGHRALLLVVSYVKLLDVDAREAQPVDVPARV